MLLRSPSGPILTSLLPYSKNSSSEQEHILLHLPKATSALSLSQNLVEIDLKNSSSPKRKNRVPLSNVPKNQQTVKINERYQGKDSQQKACMKVKPSIQELFSSLDLDKGVLHGAGKKDSNWLQTSVMDGGMGSDGSGRGSDGGHGSGWGFLEGNDHGRDAYYQNMIEAYPSDALLLGNYAKFLKEVCEDFPKAKAYLERAILADPEDGHILALYAELIWQTEKDAYRAEGYFDQAVKSGPNDSYVLASYANFLWDVEEDKSDESHTYPSDLFHGINNQLHLTAASKALPLFLN